MFSHPKLPKCGQDRISPRLQSLKCENTGKDLICPKFSKSWHLWGVLCHSWFWEFWGSLKLAMTSQPVNISTAMIHCLQEAGSVGSWRGGGRIYIYICMYVCISTYTCCASCMVGRVAKRSGVVTAVNSATHQLFCSSPGVSLGAPGLTSLSAMLVFTDQLNAMAHARDRIFTAHKNISEAVTGISFKLARSYN